MNSEENRRNTFKKWEMSHYTGLVQKLANDGFCHYGIWVVCAFCGNNLTLKSSQWTEDLNVRELHETLGHCRFVQGEYVRNIPVGEDPRRKQEKDNVEPTNSQGVSDSSQ